MNTVEAKAYANRRFIELYEDNPEWSRARLANIIIEELRAEYDFTLTTPTGHPIMSVHEDNNGLIFEVTGLMR